MTLSFIGSVCLLRHPEEAEWQWLTIWNEARRRLDFITAERLHGDSFRECIDREIGWVLDLRRGKEYIVSSQARLHLEIPDESGEHIHVIEFFVSDLYGKGGRSAVLGNPSVHWLTGAEICGGESRDGLPLNALHMEWLLRADVIPRHQS